jgi:hypothetical protein
MRRVADEGRQKGRGRQVWRREAIMRGQAKEGQWGSKARKGLIERRQEGGR